MIRNLVGLSLLAWGGYAQTALPFKSYKTPGDYCRDNPKMPTCIDGRPLAESIGNSQILYKLPKAVKKAPVPAPVVRVRGTVRPVNPIALQDWRFSHPSPALLVSINVGSLLKSPLWPADIDKSRVAQSGAGQLLISVTRNGTATPSVLMLAKGDLDGAFASMLRSRAGMHSKRLDAITLLIGTANSLELASLRMRSPLERTAANSLQQTAEEEALKYDAWIGIDPRRVASLVPSLGTLAKLRGFSAGLYLRDQIRLEASAEAPSAAVADRMLAVYQRTEAKRQEGKVWATVEGAKVRFIQIAEPGELDSLSFLDASTAAAIRSQIAPLLQSLAGGGSSAASTRPPQGAIAIQGLDSRP